MNIIALRERISLAEHHETTESNLRDWLQEHMPSLPSDHQGLLALLDEAYLAHRLLEEVNDRYLAHGGGQLVPLDTTRASLIVHHLLGEPFANELDALVQVTVDGLVPAEVFQGPDFSEYKQRMNVEGRRSLWQSYFFLSLGLGKNCTVCTFFSGAALGLLTRVGTSRGTALPRSSKVSA